MALASPLTDQLQGWGTAVGALIAVAALLAAVAAYRGQARQLRLQQQQIRDQQEVNRRQSEVLALQAKDLGASLVERQRDAAERRRAQAVRVFAWAEGPKPINAVGPSIKVLGYRCHAHLRNASDLPIREVEIQWMLGWLPWGKPEPALSLGPGDQGDYEREWLYGSPETDPAKHAPSVIAFFTDAQGQQWRLHVSGRLELQDDECMWNLAVPGKSSLPNPAYRLRGSTGDDALTESA